MNRRIRYAVVGFLALGTSALLAGCASSDSDAGSERAGQATGHKMTSQDDKHEMACQSCYDEMVRITRESHKGLNMGTTRTVKKHHCEGCKADMTVYEQDGKMMVKCPKCAPQGVPCDKCTPPAKAM